MCGMDKLVVLNVSLGCYNSDYQLFHIHIHIIFDILVDLAILTNTQANICFPKRFHFNYPFVSQRSGSVMSVGSVSCVYVGCYCPKVTGEPGALHLWLVLR